MTTRRLRPEAPPPPRGRSGRFGLLPPLAIAGSSVKASQLRPDPHLLPQDAGEHPARRRALEARAIEARIGAAARLLPAGHENAVAGGEPEQVALQRPPAAAGAAPQRLSYDSSSGCSAGTAAGISSGSATSASASGAAGSSGLTSTGSASVGSSPTVSAGSGGGPAT